jgi:hypothetical protein
MLQRSDPARAPFLPDPMLPLERDGTIRLGSVSKSFSENGHAPLSNIIGRAQRIRLLRKLMETFP